ncbi:hypothetical protein WCE37_14615 [Luteimonas sp. MJ250]|uniref:hypothetical protein n=1 Tax=Luteimonas sp. MJ250 TaxID=3129236 RepID=UPI0031BAE334
MRHTSTRFVTAIMLLAWVLPLPALACSYPEPAPFKEAIANASSIFIFRLESAEVKRKNFEDGSYAEWIEGRIRVAQTLRGDSSLFKSIRFSTNQCGGVRLDVGHYFLVVTDSGGTEINLSPADQSIIDVTTSFDESRLDVSAQTDLLRPIHDFLAGTPLPESFPSPYVVEYTSTIPLPPLPPDR